MRFEAPHPALAADEPFGIMEAIGGELISELRITGDEKAQISPLRARLRQEITG